jgi:ATP-dependent DNA helicase RecG
MTKAGIDSILAKGEGIDVEFKESYFELSKSTFETICAFLNRQGGHLLLGVTNQGKVEGILPSEASNMVNNIITSANSPGKLSPTFYLAPEIVEYEGKQIIYVYVPESSQVHRTVNKIFDRTVSDGDIDITNHTTQLTQLYIRKQQSYTENRIYPHISITDFRTDLLQRVRSMANNQQGNHPWMGMNDEALLRSAGLFIKDYQTGEQGYTLAAVLLVGKDELIQSVLPHYKTDALVRIENTDRYDDRDDIRTNLIESYDRLMAFVAKHLDDKFYIEGNQRISLRDRIFREVNANVLVHREFANPYPAKMLIGENSVATENWNKPHGNGLINPNLFSPFPKNPVIARFFKEIGLAEELGSGIRNAYKYVQLYSNGKYPEFEEGDLFRCTIPLDTQHQAVTKTGNQDGNQDSNQDSNQDGDPFNKFKLAQKLVKSPDTLLKALEGIWFEIKEGYAFSNEQLEVVKPYLIYKNEYWQTILETCLYPTSKKDIFKAIDVTPQTKNFNAIIAPLIMHRMLELTIKDRPTSKFQKYLTTTNGKKMLQLLKDESSQKK